MVLHGPGCARWIWLFGVVDLQNCMDTGSQKSISCERLSSKFNWVCLWSTRTVSKCSRGSRSVNVQKSLVRPMCIWSRCMRWVWTTCWTLKLNWNGRRGMLRLWHPVGLTISGFVSWLKALWMKLASRSWCGQLRNWRWTSCVSSSCRRGRWICSYVRYVCIVR